MLERLWEAAQRYNEQVSLLEGMSKKNPPEAFILCPDAIPPARFITRDKKRINRTIDLGYRKVAGQLDEIKTFLSLDVR